MKHHETQVRRIWNCAEEEVACEAMERQLQEAVKCVSAAQEVQRASEGGPPDGEKNSCHRSSQSVADALRV